MNKVKVAILIIFMAGRLFISLRNTGLVPDEFSHIRFDFNPEHPPLLKMLSVVPLLFLPCLQMASNLKKKDETGTSIAASFYIDQEVAPDFARRVGELFAVGIEQFRPLFPCFFAVLAYPGFEMIIHTLRHKKLGVFRPAIAPFSTADFVFAQRLAVRLQRILFMRGTIADMVI